MTSKVEKSVMNDWDSVLSDTELDALSLHPYAPFHRFATAGRMPIKCIA